MYDQLVHVADELHFRVEDATFGESGKNGECDFGRHLIRVHAGRDQVQRIKTLAHELGHAILHASDGLARELKELEAESVAFAACQAQGINAGAYTFGYVTGRAVDGDQAIAGIKQPAGGADSESGGYDHRQDGRGGSQMTSRATSASLDAQAAPLGPFSGHLLRLWLRYHRRHSGQRPGLQPAPASRDTPSIRD